MQLLKKAGLVPQELCLADILDIKLPVTQCQVSREERRKQWKDVAREAAKSKERKGRLRECTTVYIFGAKLEIEAYLIQ